MFQHSIQNFLFQRCVTHGLNFMMVKSTTIYVIHNNLLFTQTHVIAREQHSYLLKSFKNTPYISFQCFKYMPYYSYKYVLLKHTFRIKHLRTWPFHQFYVSVKHVMRILIFRYFEKILIFRYFEQKQFDHSWKYTKNHVSLMK